MGLPWRFIPASAGMVTLVVSDEVGAAGSRPSGRLVRLILSPVPLRLLRMRPEPLRFYASALCFSKVARCGWSQLLKRVTVGRGLGMLLNAREVLEIGGGVALAAGAAVGGLAYAAYSPTSQLFGRA